MEHTRFSSRPYANRGSHYYAYSVAQYLWDMDHWIQYSIHSFVTRQEAQAFIERKLSEGYKLR